MPANLEQYEAQTQKLHSLLKQALHSDDADTMSEFYHLVVDQSQRYRKQFGLPEVIVASSSSSSSNAVMKSTSERLALAGVGDSQALSRIVNSKLRQVLTCACPDSETLFQGFFINIEQAEYFTRETLKLVNPPVLTDGPMILLPCLLSRGQSTSVLHLKWQTDHWAEVRPGDATIVIVSHEAGPMIPVIPTSQLEFFANHMPDWYAQETFQLHAPLIRKRRNRLSIQIP